jgi:hypothetical protein
VADAVQTRYRCSWTIAGLLGALLLTGPVSLASAAPAVTALASLRLTSSTTDASPPRFHVTPTVRPYFDALLNTSATFRDQCRRIVAAGVRVVIEVGAPQDFARGIEALSTLVRDESRQVRFVRVRLSYEAPWPRLVPHELEHVLEQIEGVNLAQVAARRDGRVWRVNEHAFETRRAQSAGETVYREYHKRTPVTTVAAR